LSIAGLTSCADQSTAQRRERSQSEPQAVAQDIRLPVVNLSLLAPLKAALDPLRRSDHASFWDNDYPTVFISDTADYRNSHYHCYNSTADAVADVDVDFAVANTKIAVAAAAGALDR
jgi:hypothetical protein